MREAFKAKSERPISFEKFQRRLPIGRNLLVQNLPAAQTARQAGNLHRGDGTFPRRRFRHPLDCDVTERRRRHNGAARLAGGSGRSGADFPLLPPRQLFSPRF